MSKYAKNIVKLSAALAVVAGMAGTVPASAEVIEVNTLDDAPVQTGSGNTNPTVNDPAPEVITGGAVTVPDPTTTTGDSATVTLQTKEELLPLVKSKLDSSLANNYIEVSDVLEIARSVESNNPNLVISLDRTHGVRSTATEEGKVEGTIVVKDMRDNSSVSDTFLMVIPKIQTASDLRELIATNFASAVVNNSSIVDDLVRVAESLRTNDQLIISHSSDEKKEATVDEAGYLKGCLIITDRGNYNLETVLIYQVAIPKLDGGTVTPPTDNGQTGDTYVEDGELSGNILNWIRSMHIDNQLTEDNLKSYIELRVERPVVNIDIKDFKLQEANSNTDGLMSCSVIATREDGTKVKTDIALTFHEASELSLLDNLSKIIKDNVSHSNTVNTLTPELAKSLVTFLIERSYGDDDTSVGIPVDVYVHDFELVKSTDKEDGLASFKVDLTTKDTKETTTLELSMKIPATRDESTGPVNGGGGEDLTNLGKASNRLQAFLKDYIPSNSTNEKDLSDNLKTLASSYGVTVDISNFKKKESTSSTTGRVSFDVNLVKGNEANTLGFDKEIVKIASSGGSSSHSSSSSSSSSGTSNQSVPKAKDSSNEEHKDTVVKSITSNGVIASTPKEVITSSGNRIVVSNLSKNNIFTGAVVTSDKESNSTEVAIPSNAKVEGVYKYIANLDKYIKVDTGVTLATDKVVLPTQADATYYISTQVLPPAQTVDTGWAKVNNNWYFINNDGTPQTGWKNDGTGWTYLAEDTSVMKTGWIKDGNNWYHLKDNGYMSKGWVKDGDNWYYLTESGAMAHDTTIDGYSLDSSGAWVK